MFSDVFWPYVMVCQGFRNANRWWTSNPSARNVLSATNTYFCYEYSPKASLILCQFIKGRPSARIHWVTQDLWPGCGPVSVRLAPLMRITSAPTSPAAGSSRCPRQRIGETTAMFGHPLRDTAGQTLKWSFSRSFNSSLSSLKGSNMGLWFSTFSPVEFPSDPGVPNSHTPRYSPKTPPIAVTPPKVATNWDPKKAQICKDHGAITIGPV